jgi:hypothetical protein
VFSLLHMSTYFVSSSFTRTTMSDVHE